MEIGARNLSQLWKVSCFGVWSKARLIKWESFQQHQRTLSLFIRATTCPLFFLTFVFFFCPQVIGAAHVQVSSNPEAHTCVCVGVDLVCHGGQMQDVSGCKRLMDVGRSWRIRAGWEVSWAGRRTWAGKADKGEKGGFGDEEMRQKKSSQGGIGEKSRLLWDRRLSEAKRDIGWGSWGYCPGI